MFTGMNETVNKKNAGLSLCLLRYIWNDADKDKSGTINNKELDKIFGRINYEISKAESAKLYKQFTTENTGKKTEHISPDTRPGITCFVQSSTAGYYGHVYVNGVTDALNMADTFPAEFDSTYFVYEGENDITGQIHLGGDGLTNIVEQCPGVEDATLNCDNDFSVKATFEDIDGL